jgi:hypothetical protein
MRALLLALALILFPGVAAAQNKLPPQALQMMGQWGQQLVGAQQPVIDSYQRCGPIIQQGIALMKAGNVKPAVAAKVVGDLRACISDIKAAATQAQASMARLQPMPASVEQLIHVDTRSMIERSAASIGGMVTYLETVEQGIDALIAGDTRLAQQKRIEARASAGSLMDGQILILETLRQGLPLQAHKASLDIRLAIARATRAIAVYDLAGDTDALVAELRAQGAAARAAAANLRASWKTESESIRTLVAQMNDPRRTAFVASLDTAFETVADAGDDLASLLVSIPSEKLDDGEAYRIMDQASQIDIHILEAIRTLSNAMSKAS